MNVWSHHGKVVFFHSNKLPESTPPIFLFYQLQHVKRLKALFYKAWKISAQKSGVHAETCFDTGKALLQPWTLPATRIVTIPDCFECMTLWESKIRQAVKFRKKLELIYLIPGTLTK